MNIIVCGRREEGKTTLSMWLARHHPRAGHQGVIAFDPRGMLDGHIVYGSDQLEDALEARLWKTGPIIFRYDSGDPHSAFDDLCGVIFPPQFTKGGFSLVVDEAGQLQTAHSINEQLLRAIKQHPTEPHRESVTIIQTNHRMAEFHGGCKALMEELYIFQTTDPRGLQALEEHTGLPEINGIVKALPQHHCVRYKYGRQADNQQYEIWDDPLVWYNNIKSLQVSQLDPPAESKPRKEGWYV